MAVVRVLFDEHRRHEADGLKTRQADVPGAGFCVGAVALPGLSDLSGTTWRSVLLSRSDLGPRASARLSLSSSRVVRRRVRGRRAVCSEAPVRDSTQPGLIQTSRLPVFVLETGPLVRTTLGRREGPNYPLRSPALRCRRRGEGGNELSVLKPRPPPR